MPSVVEPVIDRQQSQLHPEPVRTLARARSSTVTLEDALARRVPALIERIHATKDRHEARRLLEELEHTAEVLWRWDVSTPSALAARAYLAGFYYDQIAGSGLADRAILKLVVATFEMVNRLSKEEHHD